MISGNGGSSSVGGIYFNHVSGDLVEGNYIGTDATGTSALGNDVDGVFVVDSTGNQIGSDILGAGNVISGQSDAANLAAGVEVNGGTENVVEGNLIGTDATGNAALPNWIGVLLDT